VHGRGFVRSNLRLLGVIGGVVHGYGSNICLFRVNGVVHGRVFEYLTFWMSMVV
jgi:hypothetical protein